MKQLKVYSLKFLSHSRGFTLVELLVTLSIIVLATGLVMIRYASFNSTVLLNSLAYDIAFDIRETQSLAISIRGNADEFREEYGMYFTMDHSNQYTLFQDDGDASQVEYNEGEEVGDPIIIDPRFEIVNLCATNTDGVRSCYKNESGIGDPVAIHIAFARPDFDAVMYGEDFGSLNTAEIVLGTGDKESDITRTVFVSNNGQITVK